MGEMSVTCKFVSPLQGEGRGFEPLSAHRQRCWYRASERLSMIWRLAASTNNPVQVPRLGYALQLVSAAVLEDEARPGDEILDGRRYEDLGRPS